MKRVVIVGGGITGLAAAHALEKGHERCEVRLIEAAPRLGGNLQTIRHNGFIIDAGPDSWIAAKPHATRLAHAVGLGDELIGTRPDTRRVYIVWQRKLYPMPEGLILGVPTQVKPLLASELLGWDAKVRAGLDLLVPPRRWQDDDDESIGAFVSRRLGDDVAERIAGPLLGGIFAGDPEALSVRACVPQLVEAEREHGSLVRAMRVLKEKRRALASAGEGEPSAFLSLKRGVGDLVVNVAHKLRDAEVSTSRTARKVERLPEGDPRGLWVVDTSGGPLHADEVVLAVPGHVAAPLVSDLDPELSAMCADIDYTSAATIFLAYRKFDVRHPLDAVGFLVPRSENRPILACTFVSSKWDHRAPSGQVLLRVFVGGAGNEELVDRDDDELVRLARSQVLDLLNIERPPMFAKVFRFKDSSPQPHVGHIPRMRRLLARAAMHRGLHIGGNGYIGTGIPDAVRQGEEIAARITPLAP
ncbi:MAG: Protoporphyrinogen oxidase, aerobic, HemY [Labilithrix sp.]|nr:Protoporphyrinogen oxidase, aerobic, HemY [Labilithrix sp.]